MNFFSPPIVMNLPTYFSNMYLNFRAKIICLKITKKTCPAGNTVCMQVSNFQKFAKLTIYGTFKELLSTQNVNVARYARNIT